MNSTSCGRVWKTSDTSSTPCFILVVKNRDSYFLDLNFFLTLALPSHGRLPEFFLRFKLYLGTSCPCNEEIQGFILTHYDSPLFYSLRNVFKLTPDILAFSHSFLKFAEMVIRRLWKSKHFPSHTGVVSIFSK